MQQNLPLCIVCLVHSSLDVLQTKAINTDGIFVFSFSFGKNVYFSLLKVLFFGFYSLRLCSVLALPQLRPSSVLASSQLRPCSVLALTQLRPSPDLGRISAVYPPLSPVLSEFCKLQQDFKVFVATKYLVHKNWEGITNFRTRPNKERIKNIYLFSMTDKRSLGTFRSNKNA